jgi:3-hydroxyisobutyrate dehydrogenase-like beta-hydroxyacid dehydrogenase
VDSFESVKRVLFIGLGAMGGPMAARVAQAGYKLLVCDRDED